MSLPYFVMFQLLSSFFSGTGKLHTYPHNASELEPIIQRYLNSRGIQLPVYDNREEIILELQSMRESILNTEQSIRHYLGEDLGPTSLEELQKHEQQIESSLSIVRARKEQMLQADNGNLYRWLMGGGQIHEQQQQQQMMGQMPLFTYGGEEQPNSSSPVLQLAPSSSSPNPYYPYRLQSTHPNLHGYEG